MSCFCSELFFSPQNTLASLLHPSAQRFNSQSPLRWAHRVVAFHRYRLGHPDGQHPYAPWYGVVSCRSTKIQWPIIILPIANRCKAVLSYLFIKQNQCWMIFGWLHFKKTCTFGWEVLEKYQGSQRNWGSTWRLVLWLLSWNTHSKTLAFSSLNTPLDDWMLLQASL